MPTKMLFDLLEANATVYVVVVINEGPYVPCMPNNSVDTVQWSLDTSFSS